MSTGCNREWARRLQLVTNHHYSCNTKDLEAGSFLDLPILDHLIYSDQGYYSFADEGML